MDDEFDLDFWMYEIINKALHERAYNEKMYQIYKPNTNRFNPLGQITLIRERIQKLQEKHDEMMKKAFGVKK